MGFREKVTISLVIIALTQIACRHCMPRTPSKASLKRYLNDWKPVKNNPVSTPYSPSKVNKTPKQTLGKTAQNGRISQNSLPKKSLYNTYNFPENEYPLDNAPRNPFRIGMNFIENNNVNTLLKARNLQSSAINDLKKEMKMKRKLLSNKQMNNENIPFKTDMSSINIASNPDSVHLLDPETFPEVQYPLNTMETWGQNYWNYLPFTQEKQLNIFGQQAFNPKVREDIDQPFTRLTKAEASKFLQSYDKLKEEHRRTSTENSKRSSVGQKGLNFTKTATCERVSDDFITAGLLSNTLVNPSDTKTLEANIAENTCSLIENPYYHPMPLPYKVIEENIENVCPAFQLKNNTQELEDVDSSVIAKTLQLIEEILSNGDTSSKVPPKNKSKEKENNVNTTETDYTGGSANKDIPINPIDNTETSTVVPIEELSQEIYVDAQADILPYNLLSHPEETIPENSTIVAGPCQNVRMPLPLTESITYSALTNASSTDLTNTTTLSNVNTVSGYTSIIIIPMNNDTVGKLQMFDTTSDTPIIVYLPSTQSSIIPSSTPPLNHIVSSPLGNPVTNNQLYNILFNMAPVQNDNPSSTARVNELLNSISDSGSSLPIHETLPTNSKCYNNENSPSSMREKPVSDILIHKSLIDDAPFVTLSWDKKLCQQPVQTDNFDIDPETLPPTLDFEHPVFDFADSDLTSLSHGPYNKIVNNELPIIAREIDSDLQSNDTSSKDLFIATQNITTEHLHKTNSLGSFSDDSLSESPNGVPTVALDKDFSSETLTDSLEILKNLHSSNSLSNLPVSTNKSIFPSTISKQISESPKSIDEMPPTVLAETSTVELPQPTQASLTPTPLSKTFFDKLPEIRDTKVPNIIVSDITSDSAPQPIDDNPVPSPFLNSTPMTTDLTVKTELYKIRQILDRMLSSETPNVNQPPSMGLTLSPISKTDRLPLLENQSLSPFQTLTDRQPPQDKVLPTISDTDSQPLLEKQSLSLIQTPTDSPPSPVDKVLSPIQTPTDRQPPPLDKVLPPISDTDSVPLLEEQSLSPIQTPTDSQPPPLYEVLSPIQTPTDSQSPPLDKLLSPISDTVSLPLIENQSLPPIQTTTDRQTPPLDKVLSPIQSPTDSQPAPLEDVLPPVQTPTDSQPPSLYEVLSSFQTPIDRQPPPMDKVLPPIQTPTDSQPPPLDKVLSSISDTDSLPLLENRSLSPIQTPTDSVPLLAVTDSRIDSIQLQDHETLLKTPIDDGSKNTVPSLMDKSHLSNSVLESTESLPQSLDEIVPPIPLFETTIDNKPYLIDNLVTPLYEAVTSRNKDITKNGLPHKMDDLTFKMNLEFPDIYEVYNDDRPLSLDDLPIKVHQENSENPLWMVDLPVHVVETTNLLSKTLVSDLVKSTEMLSLPVEEVLEIASPGFPSHSDMSLMSDSMEIDHQDFPPSKDVSDDLPALPMDKFKSPIHEVIPNSQSHETSEIQPKKYDLPLRVDKLTPDISLSDALSNEPFVIDDSPSPVTDKILEIPNSTANTIDPPLIDNRLLSPEDDASPDTLVTDIPTTVLPSLNEALQSTYLDKTSDEVLSESTLSDLHRDNLPLPNDKTLALPDNTLTNLLPSYKSFSSSKLPITKALLKNVLSDITKGVLSSQVAKALPVTPPSDKTVYYVDEKSPLFETEEIPLLPVENSFSNAEDNDNLIDNLRVSQITEDNPTKDLPVEFELPMDKKYNDNPKISKLPITKALLENVLSEINTKGFSIPVSKAVSAASSSVLDKTHYYIDSPHSDFAEDSPPLAEDKILPNRAHTDNNLPFSGQSEDILSLEEDKTLSEIQTIDISPKISSPMNKIVPNDDLPSSVTENVFFPKDAPSDSQLPNHKNKTPSSSKLPIAKALLENVLSDINTKGFSVPVAKVLPIASRTQLDKTLYFLDSPRPDTTVKSSVFDDPIENDHYLEINEDVVPPSADKVVPDNPIIDIPTDELISGKMYKDNSDDLTEELEDSDETLVSEELTDDLLSEMEKLLSPDDLPDELSVPPSKQLFSSRLPITKALLEIVLSDITEGVLQRKIS